MVLSQFGQIKQGIVAETAGAARGFENHPFDGAIGDLHHLAIARGHQGAMVAGGAQRRRESQRASAAAACCSRRRCCRWRRANRPGRHRRHSAPSARRERRRAHRLRGRNRRRRPVRRGRNANSRRPWSRHWRGRCRRPPRARESARFRGAGRYQVESMENACAAVRKSRSLPALVVAA